MHGKSTERKNSQLRNNDHGGYELVEKGRLQMEKVFSKDKLIVPKDCKTVLMLYGKKS
jgi:hypothetical protein